MDDSKRPFVPMHMDMPGESNTSGIYAEGAYQLAKKQKLQFRIDGTSTFLKASMTMYQTGQPSMYMLTWPNNRKNQIGTSATWLFQIDSSLQLNINGRIDLISSKLTSEEAKNHVAIFDPSFNERTDFLKNISTQFVKTINNKFKLTASLSYSERMPTANEFFGFYLFNANDGYDYIGNPQLKTEKSVQADLALKYSWRGGSLQFNYYSAHVQDFIVGKLNPMFSTMTIGANGVKTFSNLDNVTISGAEISGLMKPMNKIDFISTIRYTNAHDQDNNALPAIAPLKNINSIRYHPNNIFIQFESEVALRQNNINTQYGDDETAGYILLHVRFGYYAKLFKNNIELQSGIENILDKKYHEHLDWGNIPRPGRNVYVSLRLGLN